MAVLVDTSFLVELERAAMSVGRGGPAAFPAGVAVSVISLMELRVGALRADSATRKSGRERFSQRIRELFLVHPFGEAEADVAADLFVRLRRAGQTIGERDLLIAATALANGHSLLTLNRAEFERVPGLDLEPEPDLRTL